VIFFYQFSLSLIHIFIFNIPNKNIAFLPYYLRATKQGPLNVVGYGKISSETNGIIARGLQVCLLGQLNSLPRNQFYFSSYFN
jgi:hypothetical protein